MRAWCSASLPVRGCGPAPGGAWPAQPRVPEPWLPAPHARLLLPMTLLPLLLAKHPRKGNKAVPASTRLRLTSAALSCRQRHNTSVSDFLVTLARIHSFPQISFFSLCTSPYQNTAAHTRGAGHRRAQEEGETFTCEKQGGKAKCQQQENTPVLI